MKNNQCPCLQRHNHGCPLVYSCCSKWNAILKILKHLYVLREWHSNVWWRGADRTQPPSASPRLGCRRPPHRSAGMAALWWSWSNLTWMVVSHLRHDYSSKRRKRNKKKWSVMTICLYAYCNCNLNGGLRQCYSLYLGIYLHNTCVEPKKGFWCEKENHCVEKSSFQ